MTINFDMDGTLADLYNVKDWLNRLNNEDVTPYEIAKPMLNFSLLARLLNQCLKNGIEVNVITWVSKDGSKEYNDLVGKAKIEWLNKHLPSVAFTNIYLVSYGVSKNNYGSGILFDDNEEVRNDWNGIAYDETNILEILKEILSNTLGN